MSTDVNEIMALQNATLAQIASLIKTYIPWRYPISDATTLHPAEPQSLRHLAFAQ
jgi:hypothetical protein